PAAPHSPTPVPTSSSSIWPSSCPQKRRTAHDPRPSRTWPRPRHRGAVRPRQHPHHLRRQPPKSPRGPRDQPVHPPGGPVALDRDRPPLHAVGSVRDAVRRGQRLPGHAREPRGGSRLRPPRNLCQRLPRDVAHPPRRGRVRAGPRGADPDQRAGHQDDPHLRGRRGAPGGRRVPAADAVGLAREGQTLINAPDTKTIRIYVDDEPLRVGAADLDRYERSIDFRDGILRREVEWRTPSGKKVILRTTRMVSMVEKHLAVMTYEVELPEEPAPVVISSQVLNRQDGEDEYHPGTSPGTEEAGFDP